MSGTNSIHGSGCERTSTHASASRHFQLFEIKLNVFFFFFQFNDTFPVFSRTNQGYILLCCPLPLYLLPTMAPYRSFLCVIHCYLPSEEYAEGNLKISIIHWRVSNFHNFSVCKCSHSKTLLLCLRIKKYHRIRCLIA